MIPVRLRSFASVALVGTSLAACAQLGLNGPTLPWDKTTPAAPPQSTAQAQGTREARAVPPVPKPRPVETRKATPEKGTLAPKLVGLSEAQTIDLLGHPSEESGQPPGKVWIYRSSVCQLSVHLFPDMDKGGFYALDYTADGEVSRDACLLRIATEARRKGA